MVQQVLSSALDRGSWERLHIIPACCPSVASARASRPRRVNGRRPVV